MAIYKSSISGVPFGNTANRPSSPSVGQTYYNGELGYQEIYTNAGWIPASGGNDFNLNITGTYTTVTFSQSYSSGSYSIVSNSNDTTIDIYAYAGDGTLAGYTANKSFSPTQRFNKMIIIGGTNGDVLSFTYKPTFSTSSTTSETTGPAWITSVSTSSLPNQNNTTNITGGNFASNVTVTFTGTDSIERSAKAIVVNSTSSLTVTRPDNLPPTASPFTVKVVNPSVANLPTATNAHILSNAITAGSGPVWSTAATLPNYTQNASYSTTLVATDADASSAITYSVVSGTLPTGLSLASSTGVISGTPAVAGTSTFTVRATDSGGNYVDRAFTTTQIIPNPPSITSAVDVGTNRAYNDGAATISFNAPAYIGTSSITSYTVTASTGQSASGASSPITVTGIATGATPTFTITATNGSGTSLSSGTSSSVSITTVPSAPTIGTPTRTNATTITLGFTAPTSTGGKVISSYVTVSSPSVTCTTSGTTTPLTVTATYTPGATYTWQIAAVNANGTSAYSSFTSTPIQMAFPTISGGTLTSDATYYYRTFTASGTLASDGIISSDALIVSGAGGASGGASRRYFSGSCGGAGGAGGTRTIAFSIPVGNTTITIGGGGGGATSGGNGGTGSSSSVGGTSNTGGGGGGAIPGAGLSGGSGGGGGWDGYYKSPVTGAGGAGTPGQGNAGASGTSGGAGGGGYAGVGSGNTGGSAGTIFGSTVGAGGSGGSNIAGSPNTGNGGGTIQTNGSTGGAGGSGLVIIRYLRSVVGG